MHQDKRSGTFIVDRIFQGVGRIKRASKTTDPRIFTKIDDDLTKLFEAGRLDVLRDLRDGRRSFLEVRELVQRVGRQHLDKLPGSETVAPLSDAFEKWVERYRNFHPRKNPFGRDHHVDGLRQHLRYFLRVKPKAIVGDLPEILEALRETLGVEHPRSFMLARAAASAFVRQTLKRNHPLYAAVGAVEPVPVPPTRTNRPQATAALAAITERLTSTAVACAWSMATTGMGLAEYWGRWERRLGSIHIDGTKRAGRVRDVPDVGRCLAPPITRAYFEKVFRATPGTELVPYALRRSYANWLEEAGVPRTRRRMYLGHGARDVSDLYETVDLQAYLREDGERLAAYIDARLPKPLELVREEGCK